MASYDFYVNHLKSNDITNGTLLLPKIDATSGSLVKTDGAGTLTLAEPTFVNSLSTSTLNGLPVFSDTTGKNIKETLLTVENNNRLKAPELEAAGLLYPISDGALDEVITTDGAGTLTFKNMSVAKKDCVFGETAEYSTNLSVNDHFKLSLVKYSLGTNISLDVTSPYTTALNVASLGRFTLQPGNTYKLNCSINDIVFDLNSSNFNFVWYDADTGANLGSQRYLTGIGSAQPRYSSNGSLVTFITPTIVTRIEVRLLSMVGVLDVKSIDVEVSQVE